MFVIVARSVETPFPLLTFEVSSIEEAAARLRDVGFRPMEMARDRWVGVVGKRRWVVDVEPLHPADRMRERIVAAGP